MPAASDPATFRLQLFGAPARPKGVRLLLPLVALLVLVSACGTSSSGTASGGSSSGGSASGSSSAPPESDLLIEINRGGGAPTESYRLTCGDAVTGNHPDGAAACAHLKSMKDPFAAIPADTMCTQIYSGPETAHVTGRWQGKPVDLKLSRIDGCRTEQWGSLGALLPGTVGGPTPK
jgi:Subtilisin inhibitor-like